MKTNQLHWALALGGMMIFQAHASSSWFPKSASSDFSASFSFQNDVSLKDDLGEKIYVTRDGFLLSEGEDRSKLSTLDLGDRQIRAIEFNYDNDTKKSYLVLKSDDASFGFGERKVKFALPKKLSIDENGYPQGLDGIQASTDESEQGVALSVELSKPGKWESYEYNSTAGCRVSQDASDNLGFKIVHTSGKSKIDRYTIHIESLGDISFALSYTDESSSEGSCQPY